MNFTILSPDFYKQPTLDLAKNLIGKLLVRKVEGETLVAKIVETEAYLGEKDRAAHSFGNRRTARTEVMFGPPGYVYTYVMHTHCLVNVVGGAVNNPQAVLIRAVEPIHGIEYMQNRRGNVKREVDCTNGPGKLTKAMSITMDDYGKPFWSKDLFIAEGKHPSAILRSKRIGIDGAEEAVEYLYRYTEQDNRYVSGTKKQNEGLLIDEGL